MSRNVKDLTSIFFDPVGRTWVLCKYCHKDLQCGKDGITALKHHTNSHTHRMNYANMKKSKNYGDISKLSRKYTDTSNRARKLEIQLSLFLANHNLPLSLSDDLTTFLQKIDIDKNVQKEITCNRTKCTAILKNVTGKYRHFLYTNIR